MVQGGVDGAECAGAAVPALAGEADAVEAGSNGVDGLAGYPKSEPLSLFVRLSHSTQAGKCVLGYESRSTTLDVGVMRWGYPRGWIFHIFGGKVGANSQFSALQEIRYTTFLVGRSGQKWSEMAADDQNVSSKCTRALDFDVSRRGTV